MRIYWTDVEFKLKEKHPDFRKYKGGQVFGFVKSNDSEQAFNRFKEELDVLNFVPFDFKFINPYDLSLEWESEKDSSNFEKLYNIAEDSDDVIFDDFYVYEELD